MFMQSWLYREATLTGPEIPMLAGPRMSILAYPRMAMCACTYRFNRLFYLALGTLVPKIKSLA